MLSRGRWGGGCVSCYKVVGRVRRQSRNPGQVSALVGKVLAVQRIAPSCRREVPAEVMGGRSIGTEPHEVPKRVVVARARRLVRIPGLGTKDLAGPVERWSGWKLRGGRWRRRLS